MPALSPQKVMARMEASTRAPVWPNPSLALQARYVPRFVGEVHSTGFRVVHDVTYKNAFLPVLKGSVQYAEGGKGAVVRVTAMPAAGVLLFLAACLGFLLFAAVLLLSLPSVAASIFWLMFGGIVGLAVLVVGMAAIGFQTELTKSEQLLRQVLVHPRPKL